MGAGLRHRGPCRDLEIEHAGEPAAQALPVGVEVRHQQRLHLTGSEPQVHALRPGAGGRGDGFRVEGQLQDVPRLGLPAGQLGVEGLNRDDPLSVLLPQQEVGHAANAVVDHRQLVQDVPVRRVQQRPDALRPGAEGLSVHASRDLDDAQAPCPVLLENRRLVGEALVRQQLGEGAHAQSRRRLQPGLDLVL